MNRKVLILLAVVWTAALGLVGFSELRPEGPAASGQETASPSPTEREPAERDSREREPGEQAASQRQTAERADAEGREAGSGGSKPEGATLRLGGEAGLEFSGLCAVDGKERKLGGKTPQSYSYEPEKRLECEITSRDRGPLRVTFSNEGTNTTHRLGPGPATLELSYTGDGLSSSISSSSRTNSSQITSSQSSSQTSSSQTSSSRAGSSQSSSRVSSSSVIRSGSE